MNDTTDNTPSTDSAAVSQAAKKAKWARDHNLRRKDRYGKDPEYREKLKAARRNGYSRNREAPNCMANLGSVDQTGLLMAVSYKGSPLVIGRVFTQTDLSKLLNRQPQVFYRWHQKGLFPSPSLKDDKENLYYADREVKAFIRVMGEHQQQTPHYRSDHDDVRNRLFAESFDKHSNLALDWIRSHR